MAEPLQPPPPAASNLAAEHGGDDPKYWCYNCDKPVAGETVANLPDIICSDCKIGFIVLLSSLQPPPPPSAAAADEIVTEIPGEYYVDEEEYEELLLELAETDGGKRAAPPAAKSAVSELPTTEIQSTDETPECVVCREMVVVGETATRLPCGHRYHGGCIVTWLETTNSCPVCRYELPTDDMEYEEEKKKKLAAATSGAPCR